MNLDIIIKQHEDLITAFVPELTLFYPPPLTKMRQFIVYLITGKYETTPIIIS